MEARTETTEIRTTALCLDTGDTWQTRQHGIFVVVSTRPAQWHGEDVDVYAHIDTWYTVRPATETECAAWNLAVALTQRRRAQRADLGGLYHLYNPTTRRLQPSADATRRLDSYDDRWEPPAEIALTDEQIAVEDAYINAFRAVRSSARAPLTV